jgi:hypothetical protein
MQQSQRERPAQIQDPPRKQLTGFTFFHIRKISFFLTLIPPAEINLTMCLLSWSMGFDFLSGMYYFRILLCTHSYNILIITACQIIDSNKIGKPKVRCCSKWPSKRT